MERLQIKTGGRNQLLDVTEQIARLVRPHGKDAKAVMVYVPHTTAGILINECADPCVAADILEHLEMLVPPSASYRHSEGNSDAHIKASIVGSSVLVPVTGGELSLGTWQGIFFAEFDGPRSRHVYVTFLS